MGQTEHSLIAIDAVASESYLLGAVLADGSWIDELRAEIQPEMFSTKWIAAVWRRMCDMSARNEPVDLMAFATAAPDLAEKIGIKRLYSLQQAYVGEFDTRWHADKVREMHMRRMIAHQAEQIITHARDIAGTPVDALKSAVEQMAMASSEVAAGSGLTDGVEQSTDWYMQLEARQKNPASAFGLQTGWVDLDQLTLGWHRQDLIIVGGRTSVGKSAFAAENIVRIQSKGYKVAVFSLEMSKRQIQDRIGANVAGVPLSQVRTGDMDTDQLGRLSDAMEIIAKIAIDDERGITADYIAAEMKRWKRTRGLDFVVVDYIQEIAEPSEANDNSGSAYGRVARKLRHAAQQCDCVVMALSQLSREAEGTKPRLKHLSGSAGIESAADVIVLLHRDKEASPDMLEVNLAKQRNGATGETNMRYDRALQRITGIRDTFRRS